MYCKLKLYHFASNTFIYFAQIIENSIWDITVKLGITDFLKFENSQWLSIDQYQLNIW